MSCGMLSGYPAIWVGRKNVIRISCCLTQKVFEAAAPQLELDGRVKNGSASLDNCPPWILYSTKNRHTHYILPLRWHHIIWVSLKNRACYSLLKLCCKCWIICWREQRDAVCATCTFQWSNDFVGPRQMYRKDFALKLTCPLFKLKG